MIKLYEEFREEDKFKNQQKVTFLKKIYDNVVDNILPYQSSEFKATIDEENLILEIKTNNPKDAWIKINIIGEKIYIDYVTLDKPVEDGVVINYSPLQYNNILYYIKKIFEIGGTGGLYIPPSKDVFIPKGKELKGYKDKKISDYQKDKKPPKKRPNRVKRSISIPAIIDVLEHAYIYDEIDLKDLTIDHLISRMKYRDR